jgi:membrane protease YdiL (CAAX protease family)
MTAERKAALILLGIVGTEGTYVFLSFYYSGLRFFRYLGFAVGRNGSTAGWFLALIVTSTFVAASTRLPSVRANLLRPSMLKFLGLAVAVTAGILEEVMFRKWIMDAVARHGGNIVAQILASGVAFGVLHGIWGLIGRSIRAAGAATIATGTLGAALAIVYAIGGRSLAPCVAAHFAINALIEPGLVLAATRGEMTRAH